MDALARLEDPPTGDQFRAVREELGWKQKQVSLIVERDVSTLREYEHGRQEIPLVVWKTLLHARQEELDRRSRKGKTAAMATPPEFGVLLPVVGMANAGTPMPTADQVLDEWRVDEEIVPRGRALIVQVSGRSMEPTFEDGDWVMMAVGQEPIIGDVVIVDVVGEGVAIRRLEQTRRGKLQLVADAEGYKPIPRDGGDIYVEVIGVVTDLVRRRVTRRRFH